MRSRILLLLIPGCAVLAFLMARQPTPVVMDISPPQVSDRSARIMEAVSIEMPSDPEGRHREAVEAPVVAEASTTPAASNLVATSDLAEIIAARRQNFRMTPMSISLREKLRELERARLEREEIFVPVRIKPYSDRPSRLPADIFGTTEEEPAFTPMSEMRNAARYAEMAAKLKALQKQ